MGVKEIVLLVLLLAVALILRVKGMTHPFNNGLRGDCGAGYSIMAESMCRYGPLTTGFLPVMNTRPVDREHLVYYEHHPPGMVILTAAVFALTGSSSEASARLLPVVLSLLSLLILFFWIQRISGSLQAFCAAALCATAPLSTYYGPFLNFETFYIPFTLLSLYHYTRFTEEGRRSSLCWSLAFMLIGALMDWITLIAGGLMLIDGFLFGLAGKNGQTITPGKRAGQKALLYYPALAVLAFAAVQLWFVLQNARFGSPSQTTAEKILYYLDATFLNKTFEWGRFLAAQGEHLAWLVPLPVLFVAMAGFLFFLRDLSTRRPVSLESRSVLMLVVFGLLNLLLFANHAEQHDFWIVPLYPAIYFCAGLGIKGAVTLLGGKADRPSRLLFGATAAVVLALALYGGFRTVEVGKEKRGKEELYHRGLAYAKLAQDGEIILTPKGEPAQVIHYSEGAVFHTAMPTVETLARCAPLLEKFGYRDVPKVFAVFTAEASRFRESLESFDRIAQREIRDGFILYRLDPLIR